MRYADNITLMAGTKEDLVEIMERVRKNKRESRPTPRLNALKTKVVTTGDIEQVTVDGEIVEVVTSLICLALITRYGLCDKEIRRRIGMGKAAMGGLTTISKDRGIKLAT